MAIHKKIKLVTFAPNLNFGTCLQSYALNFVLKKMGHEVEFIYNGRENPPISLCRRMRLHLKTLLSNFTDKRSYCNVSNSDNSGGGEPYVLSLPDEKLFGFFCKFQLFRRLYDRLKYRTPRMKKVYKFAFKDGNFNMRRLYSRRDYENVVEDADLFITGSDQIWNPYCGGFNPMMFLEFAGKKKRVAYSSSIVLKSFPKSVERRAKDDLSKFLHIGVRERSSVAYLNELLERSDVRLVVDPTCLLSKDEWADFASRSDMGADFSSPYIFCYFVGSRLEDYRNAIADVRARSGVKKIVTLSCYGNRSFFRGAVEVNDAGPYEFVNLLSHASRVCTDSFHATMFALKFGVDFVHILKNKSDVDSASQNGRMYDILKRYGLLYKLYDKDSDSWLSPIDFGKVESSMSAEIFESLKFLEMEISE